MGFLSGLLGLDAGKATTNAASKNKQLLTEFRGRGNSIINTGEQKSQGSLNKAIAGYNPYVTAGKNATNMYSNAIGLNGAAGNTAATDAFQAGPGYQFQLDQGTQAALRGASAAGMLNSGNTLTALAGYGQGLANQEYGGWLDRLQGVSSQGLQAVGGQGNALSNLASLYQNTAGDRLGLESSVVQGRMGVNNQRAQGQEANAGAKSSLFGNLLGGGIKLATGGLF
ncbi:hypothetical protein E5S70_17680 [Ensifer adhaerens]|uniref:hypothetical protein n=1 Tax=Ensifer canadensis TaxID=555315 RepID=UPI00148F6AF9|nr:hypothetical protein [Ensifer canadensis]NOV17883.1 hypothetical protein [Ensifer canadensis]